MKHMTVEDLSHASANRYADRMIQDVKSTSQIRFPPRPPPTFSARESLETDADDVEDVISARVVNHTTPTVAVSARTTRTVQERFQDFYADFETLEPLLSSHLSPDDKKRFVRAIQGPSPLHRPEVVTIAVSILVVSMTAIVCLHNNGTRAHEPRSRAASASPRPSAPSAMSSTANFNIERLLKPLNRNR